MRAVHQEAPMSKLLSHAATFIAAAVLVCCLGAGAVHEEAATYDRAVAAGAEVFVDGHLAGSGWFADPQGLVVTAAHVVWNRTKIEVLCGAGRQAAEVVALDRGHDIALLRVPIRPTPYPVLSIGAAPLGVGETIYLYGAPMYRHGLMVSGTVARATPGFEYYGDQQQYARVFYVSGPSPVGFSGGPWVDRQGRVVGNQSGMIRNGTDSVGIANVAPVEAIQRLLQAKQSAATADIGLGIDEFWEEPTDYIAKFPAGTSGLVPVVVHGNGPSKDAGLSRETVIVAIDQKPVQLRDELLAAVREKKPGDEVTLTLLAPSGEKRDVKIKLGCLEKPN
jgi:S1-C subfamily serine protease